MTLEELTAALQAVIDNATTEERDLTDEEAATAEDLTGQIERAQSRRELLTRSRTLTAPVAPVVPRATATPEAGEELTRAFEGYLRTGHVNDELAQLRAQGEAAGPTGGYLVPEGFRNMLVERRKAFGGIANYCETITTDSGQPLPWPTVDDVANVGEIVAENGTFASGADLVFGTKTLMAYKWAAGGASNLPLKIPFELLQDSAVDIAGLVSRKLGERLARVQATKWAVGTGVNEPQGLLAATGGFTAATAIASNTAPTYANLLAIVHDLDPAYRGPGCKWVFNDGFLELVRGIVDLDGRPLLWNSNSSLGDDSGGMKLLGFDVVVDQACPAPAASNRFGFFGNLSEAYVVRRVKDISIVTLHELYAPSGQVGYMAWERADGAIQDVNAGVAMVAAA